MDQYQCSVCGWIYDEFQGYPEGGIQPQTPFDAVPETFTCPYCNAEKEKFEKRI